MALICPFGEERREGGGGDDDDDDDDYNNDVVLVALYFGFYKSIIDYYSARVKPVFYLIANRLQIICSPFSSTKQRRRRFNALTLLGTTLLLSYGS